MDKITEAREATQPIKSRTGGSTFKNPPGHKAWQLIDAAGCRGLKVGDAQVSEMHCNFLINLGDATAADIETLGETVRAARARQFRRRARMGDQADRGGVMSTPRRPFAVSCSGEGNSSAVIFESQLAPAREGRCDPPLYRPPLPIRPPRNAPTAAAAASKPSTRAPISILLGRNANQRRG